MLRVTNAAAMVVLGLAVAGGVGLDEVFGYAERRRTFGCVENRQPAARASSEIMEVTA